MLDDTTTGKALKRLRELSDLSERAAARAIGVNRSVLRSWESQRTIPDADEIARAVSVYGHDLQDVIVNRVPLVNLERPGILVVGDEEIVVADQHPEGATAHEGNLRVLRTYLAAVRRQRGVEAHETVHLRADDVSSLAIELDLDDDQLQQLLGVLLDLTPAGAQYTARALLVGGLLALVAGGAVQGSWLAPEVSASTSVVPFDRTVQIAEPAVVERDTPTFLAGDLGPTMRGPLFSSTDFPADPGASSTETASTDTSESDGPVTSDSADLPAAPTAEITSETTPYVAYNAVFSVDPLERSESGATTATNNTATQSEAGSGAGSGVFSVTPRPAARAGLESTEMQSRDVPGSQPALPPGSPELRPGD